ncbi:hypothetical protein BAE44_0000091 [Dichanthelium oligosanthes]|uniref:glutathione transferase n=1 Tax=Dichanthelium oligosanthes TaxID=888268 RepID=A0A1E5WP06_9POAL|nr:hypothetical protein BAE44_0000091 [Dichanthelium oligosanthes]
MVGLGTGAPIVQVYHEKSIVLPDVSRVLACLYEKHVEFKTHTASYKSLLRLQASSHAPVPFYDGPTFLEESRGICRYIAEKKNEHQDPFLLGKDALERASVEQWLHNEEHAFNPPSRALYCHLAFPLDEEDRDDLGMHTRKLEEVLEVYEQRLSDSRFLAGNEFTLADLVHLPNSHCITASEFIYLYDSRKNVSRWWDEISNRKSWQQVLRYMKGVEEQNKQEELKKQQQKEHPGTFGHPIWIDSRKQMSTEPRTILVPPADILSSSPIVPPLPSDTFPDEALVSSSQSTPTADKTSAVLSKEITVFNAPDGTPPTSVQSTHTTSIKHPIPVQSIKDDAAPTTPMKPPVADAAKSSTKDASLPEPTVTDLHTRHKPSPSKDVSNKLDVFYYYPSHSDEETPYIEHTPRRTSETLDAFSGSNVSAGHTKTTSISAKEEPDQPSAYDFYKSDSRDTGVDSQYKESIPYSGRAPPKLEPSDTSASKLHTTDVHRRLQAEQWHTATTGLNDLKQDTDHLLSTQQGKPSKDVKQYPSHDSEQATSHPVPEEPMSMELVQRRENTIRRPYTDQRSQGIVEDKASSDQRSALLRPSTQEHGATPSRQEAAKDARGRIPSQAGYPISGQDTNKQPRDPASVPRQRAAQDARGMFGASKAADSTISNDSFSDASGSSLPRKDLDGGWHTTVPFQKRYPGTEDTSKQAKDKISSPWQMIDQDAEDTTEERKISDSSSSQMQPSYFQRADASSRKQETTEDRHSAISAIQEKHANVEDTAGISRDVAFKPKQMIGQDDQGTYKETKSGGPSLLRDQQSDTWQVASTLPEQEVNQDGRSVAPPSPKRYPSSTPPSKTRYQIAKDASKQPRGTALTPKKKAAQDDNETSEESKTADEVASTELPRTNTSFQKRYPDDEEDMEVANTAAASRQIAPDGGKDIFEETKFADSTTRAKPLYAQPAALPLPRQGEVEDAQDKGRQSRVTIPEPQKMVARDTQDTHGESKTSTPGEQTSDHLQAVPQSRPAAAKDVHSATGETIQFPEILDITKKSRGTFEETKDSESTLPKAQSLGARDAQRTIGESRTPTADQRKDVSRPLQPDTQDSFQQSKLSAIDQKGLGSQERDAKDAQATTSEEKSISTEKHMEMIKSEPRGYIKVEKVSSIYQKQPPVAQDNQEQAQIIEADEKANGYTPKHQQPSDVLYTLDEKSNTTAPANAKTSYDFSAEELYRKDITDDQKLVPPLLSKEPTSQVQPTSESLQEAASHGGLSTKPSIIKQWQRASVPLNDVTPMSQQATPSAEGVTQMAKESGEQRVELPVPTEAEASGVQSASPPFPGASTAHHATTDDKFAKQSIINERVGEPTKMQALTPDSAPAHTKRATPDSHEIGDSELVSTPDGQLSEAAKTRHDQTTLQEDVHDAILPTHDVAKDTFKETKVADSTPSSAKPMHTQRPAPTPRHAEVVDTRDKGTKSRQTVPDRQKMVERRAGTAGEQVSDHLKAIPPSGQAPAEDALGATGDTIQSPDILDTSKKSRGTYEEATGPGSMLSKAQPLGAQDSQLTKGESTMPTADQRKDWKDAKDDETIMTEEKSFSTEWFRDIFQESESTVPKTHPTDSQSYSALDKTSSVYHKGPMAAQESQEEAQIIQAGEKADSSTPEHQESSGSPYTYDEKLSASAPARADIRDDHSAEEPYKKYTADDQKVAPSLSSKEPASQVQPLSEPLQRAVPDGDSPSKSFTIEAIDKWRHASAPLHGVSTDSGNAEVAMSSNNDQKSISTSQEATLSSPVPIGAETSVVGRTVPSLPEAARADDATIDDKFAKQSNIDERVEAPKQMQEPITAAHPASASTKRTTPVAKATQDPATIHEDIHDASLSTHDAAIDEKTATYHASGDEHVTGYIHDRQAQPPASAQPQPNVGTPLDSDSSQFVHAGDSGKTELAKPIVTDQEATTHIAGPTSIGSQRVDTLPAEVAHSQQKSAPSDEGSARAARLSPVEPIKADSNVSAADYTHAPRMVFRQQARPSEPSTIGIPASDTQGVIGKIEEGTPDNHRTDDSGKPSVPNQEQVSHASQAIPDQEEMASPPGATISPTSATQLASAAVQEVRPDDQQAVESIAPLLSSGKQGSRVGSAFEPSEVGPAEKKFAPSDQELPHTAEQPTSDKPRKEQNDVPTAEQIKKQPTVIGQLDTPIEDNTVVTTPDQTKDMMTITHQQTITPAPYTAKTPFPGTDQEAMAPIAGPTSMDPQLAGTLPAEFALCISEKGSARAAQPLSPVEPIKADSIVSAADYTNAPQIISRQQARPSAPSTIGIRASDTQDVIGKIQEGTPDNRRTDDSGKPSVPNQEQVSHASQAIPGQEEMISPLGATVYPTSATQHASAEVQEVRPDDQQAVESITPLLSSGKQGSRVGSAFGQGEVGPAEKKFAPSDQELPHSAEQPTSDKPSKEQTDVPTAEQIKKQPTIIGQQDTPTEDNTVVTAPDQTKDMETITHQQTITPAPDKAKTPLPGTDQEAIAPIAGPTSMDPQLAGTLPAEVAQSEQKPVPSEKGSAHAAQPLSPVEPIKAGRNVSAADYTKAPQTIFRQQARPSAPSTLGIRASDTQGVIGKIQEGSPDNRRTDDSGKPSVPNQEQVSLASQAIPDQEEMASPPGATVSPTSATQVASAEVQEVRPDDQQAVESIAPLLSSGKQDSRVGSAFEPSEVGPAEKKFAPSDQELPHTAEQPTSDKPRKEQTDAPIADISSSILEQELPHSAEPPTSSKPRKEQTVPTSEQIKEQPTVIGQQDTPDTREALTSEDALVTTPTYGGVHPTGSIEPDRRPSSVQGEEPTHATQAPPPGVAKDSLDTEDISTDASVQSVKPSATRDARGATPGSSPGELAVAEQISSPSEPAFSLGPRNEEIRDSTPSAQLISSTDASKGDAIVAVPDQAKDLQTTPSRQDILSAQRPSEENITGDDSGNGQGYAYPAQPPSSAEPRSKEIGDLDPSTQLNSTTEPRNGDVIVAAPDQAKDSQTTPGQQGKFSAPFSYIRRPSGTRREDEPADNSGEVKSSKLPSVSAPDTQHGAAPDQVSIDEEKFDPSGQGSARATFPAPGPRTQYGTELHKADLDGEKPSGQDSVHSVQPSFSTEPTKEDTVVAATDQTSTLEKIIDQNDTTPAPDKAKTPFSGTLDASRKTPKSTDDDHIDEKLQSQGQASPYRHVSESPEGPTPEEHSDVVDKERTPGSNQAETSNTEPDSTPIDGDARLSSGYVPAASSLPETQDLQGSANTQNVPADSLGKIESPGHLSTDQSMEPRMSPSVPSVAPLGTNSVQSAQQASMASTVGQESVPHTQHGTPQGEATPAEQKFVISDQEPAHTSESPSSAEPRKEEANAAAGDQPNVPQGPETTVRDQVKAPSPDAREALRKDQQPSRDDDHISNSANPLVSQENTSHAGRASEGPSSEESSAVVDKKMTLPSSQAQTSSTGPESTPIGGDTRLSSADVPATSSLQNEEVHTPAATQVPTPQAPLDSASTQNISADSLGEISSEALSDAPQGTEPDQVSAHASEPPFSAEPSNEASHAGHASESHEGTTPEGRSPVVDAKATLPSRQVQTANSEPDSTPISGDVPYRSSLQNQEAQPSAATQAPTVQAQGSASTKNEPADSLGDIKSWRQPPTDEVVAPITSLAAPSDSSQGTEPGKAKFTQNQFLIGTNSVQPSEEASFDVSSDEKPTTTQGVQAKTLPNGDLPTSQVVGKSQSADSKGMDSQKNLRGALIDENPKMQQQIEQFDTQSFKDNNKEADGTVRPSISTTFEDLRKQPSRPKGSMELSDEPENQQHTDQAIVQSADSNENQVEQTQAHDTVTGGPEDMEASENANQKNNRISQAETLDHSGKETSELKQLGENIKDASNSTEDAPGDVQAISRSQESSRSSEESKVQLQSEDKTGETETPSSETGQPRGDLPANSNQNNSSQSQAEASDKSVGQPYPGIQNKDRDSSRLGDSTNPTNTKPGDMED